MLHVTTVRLPSGTNLNSAMLVPANGRMKSRRSLTRSFGRLSVMVMRPSPTSLFPDHQKAAPVPAGAPSYAVFAAGSALSQGDHASQLWRSFTCANTCSGGAEIVVVRATRKLAGCHATTTSSTTAIKARVMRIFASIDNRPPFDVDGFYLIIERTGRRSTAR